MLGYVIAPVVVFVVNLLPALGPPTWALLVLFRIHMHLNPVALVATGATAAAAGRLLLGMTARRLSLRLSADRQSRLAGARAWLARRRTTSLAGLGLFAVSPVPSGQLFVAAGLLQVRLLPFTAAFFAGRIVSYSGYVFAATAVASSYRGVMFDALRSPAGIAVQLGLLAALTLAPLVDWPAVFGRRSRRAKAAQP